MQCIKQKTIETQRVTKREEATGNETAATL